MNAEVVKQKEVAERELSHDMEYEKEAFPLLFDDRTMDSTLFDREDNVHRCAYCNWEVHGEQCQNCGRWLLDEDRVDIDDIDEELDSEGPALDEEELEEGEGEGEDEEEEDDDFIDDRNTESILNSPRSEYISAESPELLVYNSFVGTMPRHRELSSMPSDEDVYVDDDSMMDSMISPASRASQERSSSGGDVSMAVRAEVGSSLGSGRGDGRPQTITISDEEESDGPLHSSSSDTDSSIIETGPVRPSRRVRVAISMISDDSE
jgi:hypothetical protein